MMNEDLIKYINEHIFPLYDKNDKGHNIEHIKYVIKRSLKFADAIEDINYDMVYTVASYHDCGHNIDPKKHEEISANILNNDKELKKFFTIEQIKTMKEAIEDHRASLEYEPRNIYGKIVSSADRNIDIKTIMKRTYEYRKKNNPNSSLEDIILDSWTHIIRKYGQDGYATEKMYFKDEEYYTFLNEINENISDYQIFRENYIKINN
ncbi:MAG TPA: HD domain-containing protein, partial [Tenericutes bacterium]|nr:HD domain-containing protein [Mycoplasmatota bacterium]